MVIWFWKLVNEEMLHFSQNTDMESVLVWNWHPFR